MATFRESRPREGPAVARRTRAALAVTTQLYGTTDPTSSVYNEGANWVGVGSGTCNGVAAVVAFGIPILARRTNRKTAHAICLVCGALELLSILALNDPRLL